MNLEQVVFVPTVPPNMEPLYATKKMVTLLDMARAMGNTTGAVNECVVKVNNQLHRAIHMLRVDFTKHVASTEFVDATTVVYGIAADQRQPVVARCGDSTQVFNAPKFRDHKAAMLCDNAVFFDNDRALVF